MATFFLRHDALGKAKYDKQGAVAHAGYILRRNATVTFGTRHMPTAYAKILGWVGNLYDNSRKNARVYDKLILQLPRELNQVQHVNLLRSFLDSVTEGRTPYLFSIHGDKPGNPHAHVIIRDADIETGKRVALLSEAGSSYRLRAAWEKLVNSAMERHGHEQRISRWGKRSRQYAELNNLRPNESESPQMPPVPLADRVHNITRNVHKREIEGPNVVQQPDIAPEIVRVVEFVLSQDDELTRITRAKETLSILRADYAKNIQERASASWPKPRNALPPSSSPTARRHRG